MKIYLIIRTERFEVSEDKETFMYALTDKDKVKEDMKHLKKDNDNNRVSFDYKEIYVANQGSAVFSKAEMSCGLNRIKWAEGLISQLPPKYEGRNSWLLNFGVGEEAVNLRQSREIEFDDNTQSAVYEPMVTLSENNKIVPTDELLSNVCKIVTDQLTETINLNLGDEFYFIEYPFKRFEVIKEKPSAYYLAFCDGSCSNIDYVSKMMTVSEFNRKWFKTSLEAYEAKLNKKIKETEREKEFLVGLKGRETK